ncbi:hypothetical protein ACFW1M_37650 [Streptomyces inhibens]|uniref:hypothetical protein n=1 Tax=Streptomyces inhibens TaxID=2293571 RepID=UPI0036CFB812
MSGNFKDGVDAAVASGPHGDSGFWFFRGDKACKTNPGGDGLSYPVDSITANDNYWPALRGTTFEHGPIDAAVWSGSGFWFFQDDKCVKTDNGGTEIKVPVSDIDADGNWPGLKGTIFATGVDAAVESGDGGRSGFWFFRGDQALKTDPDGNRAVGPAEITAVECWPALDDSRFANGPINAAVWSGSGFWFFQGNQCIKTDPSGNHRLVQVTDIIASGNWPALDT